MHLVEDAIRVHLGLRKYGHCQMAHQVIKFPIAPGENLLNRSGTSSAIPLFLVAAFCTLHLSVASLSSNQWALYKAGCCVQFVF